MMSSSVPEKVLLHSTSESHSLSEANTVFSNSWVDATDDMVSDTTSQATDQTNQVSRDLLEDGLSSMILSPQSNVSLDNYNLQHFYTISQIENRFQVKM